MDRSKTLSAYDEALLRDQQYGKNLVRLNGNRLNSGLFQGVNQSYQGREQGLRDLENQSLAAKMGARNQQANFLTNNGYMQAHMFSQLGDALKPLANAAFSRQPNTYLDPYGMRRQQQMTAPTIDPFIQDDGASGNYYYDYSQNG